MAKITIQNMAKELGLSRNTVSLALKKSDLVSEHTKEMVFRYASKVGYIDNLANEEAVTNSTESGYHIMILRKPEGAVYWDKVINGISEEASKNHCQTHVAVISDEEEKNGNFPLGLDEKIDAVFCVKLLKWEYLKKIKDSGYPIFILDGYQDSQKEALGDIVRSEGVKSVSFLTRHLIDQGMTKIGFLNEHSSSYESMHDRYRGYLDAMKEAGIALDNNIIEPDMRDTDFYFQSTFDALVDGFGTIPEAMVCGNDQIAQYLTLALRKKGLQVPEDVAVTGFDDDESDRLDPFFTTVHVNARWLGRRMVQVFLWRMKNPDAPYEKIVVEGTVKIRRSSKKI